MAQIKIINADDLVPLMPKMSTLLTLLVILLAAAFLWLLVKGKRDRILIFFMQTFQNDTSQKAQGVLVSAFGVSMIYFLLLIRGSLFGTWPPAYILDSVKETMYSLFGIQGLVSGAKAWAERTTTSTTAVKEGPPATVVKKETTGPSPQQQGDPDAPEPENQLPA